MPRFRYTAVGASGERIRGVIEAGSATALADRLREQRCLLLRAGEIEKNGWTLESLRSGLSFERGLPNACVANLTRELAVMLRAGQDIDHALRFLIETNDHNRARRVLATLRDQVRGGKSLAAALAEHPLVFSRLYVSLVRAGQAGGKLAESLEHISGLLEREARLTSTIQSALIYPILLVIVAIGTIALLLTYVLPQFTPIFAQAGAQLPRPTRVLIAIGEVVRGYGGVIFIGMLCAFLAAFRSLREPAVRMAVERVILGVPIVGVLVRSAQAARFTRTLGTLLRNGVGLVSALGIARDVLGNLTATRAVDRTVSMVKAGGRLAASLAGGKFFPLQTIHLLQLGEETGKLAEMALRAADIHDEQVNQTLQRMVALLVPIVTILMGLVVAGIVGSLIAAMLSLNDLAL